MMDGTPCQQQHCTLRSWYDILRMRTVVQHGDNEEATLFIDDIVVSKTRDPQVLLREWSERIHAWEDQGIQTKGSNDDEFDRLMRKFTRD
jgi:hypothetical protein